MTLELSPIILEELSGGLVRCSNFSFDVTPDMLVGFERR